MHRLSPGIPPRIQWRIRTQQNKRNIQNHPQEPTSSALSCSGGSRCHPSMTTCWRYWSVWSNPRGGADLDCQNQTSHRSSADWLSGIFLFSCQKLMASRHQRAGQTQTPSLTGQKVRTKRTSLSRKEMRTMTEVAGSLPVTSDR